MEDGASVVIYKTHKQSASLFQERRKEIEYGDTE